MKLFDFAKKLAEKGIITVPEDDNHNTFGEELDHLMEDGELPWGWTAHKRDFIEPIKKEFSYFLDQWLSFHGKDVRKERDALKSFIQYMKDVQKLCDSKGECFSYWCSEYLIGNDYLETRQNDLKYLEEHFDELLLKETTKKDIENNFLPHLRDELIKIIKNNTGILQTDVYKMFDPEMKEYVSSELYFMTKDEVIVREKQGRTYKLKLLTEK